MLVGYHRNVSTASPGVRRAFDARGTRRPGGSRPRRDEFVCLGGDRAALVPRFTPVGNFASRRSAEQNSAERRPRSRSRDDNRRTVDSGNG
jgi:hypothetical protein